MSYKLQQFVLSQCSDSHCLNEIRVIKDLRFGSGKAGMSLKDTAMVYHVPDSGFNALPHKGKKEKKIYLQ